MNNYLSRFAAHDTHFHRTDPFKNAVWDGDDKDSVWVKVIAAIGFLFALMCIFLVN
jgi:hypothetical protein